MFYYQALKRDKYRCCICGGYDSNILQDQPAVLELARQHQAQTNQPAVPTNAAHIIPQGLNTRLKHASFQESDEDRHLAENSMLQGNFETGDKDKEVSSMSPSDDSSLTAPRPIKRV